MAVMEANTDRRIVDMKEHFSVRFDSVDKELSEARKEGKEQGDNIIELNQSVKYLDERLVRLETRQDEILGSAYRTEGFIERRNVERQNEIATQKETSTSRRSYRIYAVLTDCQVEGGFLVRAARFTLVLPRVIG